MPRFGQEKARRNLVPTEATSVLFLRFGSGFLKVCVQISL